MTDAATRVHRGARWSSGVAARIGGAAGPRDAHGEARGNPQHEQISTVAASAGPDVRTSNGAHNQRGLCTVQIRSRKAIWIEDLIALVESSASCELYSLLKRRDEKAVTERAYENPVFVEDMVRSVAVKLNAHPDVTWYKVEAENFESIHSHNAYASIEKG